ncbi:c-type cytochrome domain-containing protein [Zavarzinella formosa]|uniref:c-type cytochrome domain-containing protein n=1 Tax=Zavarzinella formosa TaxID=360055 RepID=UPI0002DD4AF8|nr:c-type cytochrome domain-containing protein [Zavarzinella formosa]
MNRLFLSPLFVAILAVGPLFAQPKEPAAKEKPEVLASRAKEIFRAHCLECHGGAKANGGVKILDRELLVKKEKIVPGKPDDSYLVQLISADDDTVMPPSGQPKLNPQDIESIRKWIAAGAPDFPADAAKPAAEQTAGQQNAGVEYVLKKILAHVREQKPEDRRFMRYFSINHLLVGGATADELELHREAFGKAINHLSWETTIVRPQMIDAPANTIFAIDLRQLGWHIAPFEAYDGRLNLGKSRVNLHDLALLEYPYAILYKDSETFDRLAEEYLVQAEMARPIPFVRADWFSSVATLPGLYDDFLQLPRTLAELEMKLGVDSAANIRDHLAKRAGMTVSGVSHNNRVVERHNSRHGYYWKSFDFKSNRGPENMFKDPIDFKESGGEMLFSLPNGLNGYYVADNKGNRLEFAPTEIVVDKFAEDKTVRNGLSCIRCHDNGIKGFVDNVRPALLNLPGVAAFDKREALLLYPEQKMMNEHLKEDTTRFTDAMRKLFGKPATREPLIPVSHRYADNPLTLTMAAGELGLTESADLRAIFRSPAFTGLGLLPLTNGGVVRRDAWEEYFDQAVRGLGLGIPVVPLDGDIRRDFPVVNAPFQVELKTNKKNNVFEPGDEMRVTITNKSEKTLYVELIGTSAKGRKVILLNSKTRLEPGKSLHFPESGQPAIQIRGGLGREQITLFASDMEFPAGKVLRGKDVTDRVIHEFQTLERKDGRTVIVGDPAQVVKKTLEIETK